MLALVALGPTGLVGEGSRALAGSRESDRTSPRRLEAAAIRLALESDPDASARSIRRQLRRLARRAKRELHGALGIEEQRRRFNRFFFTQEGFRPLADEGSSEGLLLHHVLEQRRGTCVGLAQVYLILAERLELPVVAAATPAHIFVRWADGSKAINTELLEGGTEHPDSEYRARYKIREPDPPHPIFLRDLEPDEVAARIHNNRGVIRSTTGLLNEAAADYARALDLDPRFPAPYYNRGLDRLNAGRARQALNDFEAALALHPRDAWALNNRGLAHLKLGRSQEAEQDFRRALEIEPGLRAARKNLSLVTSLARRTGSTQAGEQSSTNSEEHPSLQGEATGPKP